VAGGPDDQALGDTINAEEAERIGLISELVAEDELDAAVDRLARRLATGRPTPTRRPSPCSPMSSLSSRVARPRPSANGLIPCCIVAALAA